MKGNWPDVLIDRDVSDEELAEAIWNVLDVRRVLILDDVPEDPLPDNVDLMCTRRPVRGDFPILLEPYPRSDDLIKGNGIEVIGQLCSLLACRCLIPDDTPDPCGMLLIEGPGLVYRAFLDPAGLDRDPEEYVIQRKPACTISAGLPPASGPEGPPYRETPEDVLSIFDARKSEAIDFRVRLEAAEALGRAGDPRLREDNWVTVPGGTFRMGGDFEEPLAAHVNEYQIARYPVTVDEYRRFVEDHGYGAKKWWKAGGYGIRTEPGSWAKQLEHPNRPVVEVSWYEAAAYCAWAGVRLVTETEWERAARGTAGRRYPWGDEGPGVGRANYHHSVGHPTPVGLYPLGMTPEGVHDMAGNVWEWVEDGSEERWRIGEMAIPRGIRGGCCFSGAAYLLASRCNWCEAGRRDDVIGFRCARNAASRSLLSAD